MEMVYYKEEDLYNGSEGVFAEDYKFVWIGDDYKIGLCINAQTLFCRADKCSDRHEYLSQTNRASSWLKMLDTICPKMAWGITAWLLFYTNRDNKGRLRFLHTTKAEVFAKYKEECLNRYRYFQKDEYDYLRENGDTDGVIKLDEAFIGTHIQQEREYISRFTHHECMTEEYYNAIVQCANEYVEWVEVSEAKKRETAPPSSNENTLPCIYHADNLNFVLLLEHLKDQSNSRRKIVNKDITTEDFVRRILSADLSVFPQKVYRIFFLKQISDHYINDGEKTLWYNEAMRKVGITERDLSQHNESENTFIQEFEYSKFKVKQVDTTKNNNYR